MAAQPGGRIPKVAPARRLAILRELWSTGLTCVLIAERLGVHEATVSHLARKAGLPPRHRRERRA